MALKTLYDAIKLFRERESDFFVNVETGYEIADILESHCLSVNELNDAIKDLSTVKKDLTEKNENLTEKISNLTNVLHRVSEISDGEIKDVVDDALKKIFSG